MREAVWIALALCGWGTWTVIEKLALRNTTPMMVALITTYVYSAFAPIAFMAMKWRGDPMVWNRWGIFWVSMGAIVATVANCAFLFAIEGKPVNQVISFTQLYPVLSFLLCWALLGEAFTTQKVIGAILMIAGCIVMNR